MLRSKPPGNVLALVAPPSNRLVATIQAKVVVTNALPSLGDAQK